MGFFGESWKLWLKGLHRPGWDWLSLCVVVVVAVQIGVDSFGGVEEVLLRYPLSCYYQGLMDGAVWTLFSYAFVHAGLFHLVFNIIGLWIFGGRMMCYVGGRKSLATFALGVCSGAIAHVLVGARLAYHGFREPWLVGMSGGVLALWMCLTVLAPEARMWPTFIRGKAMRYGILLSLIWLVASRPELQLFSEVSFPEEFNVVQQKEAKLNFLGDNRIVSHACHLGGALAGLWMGRRLLGKKITKLDLQRERAELERKK